LLLDFLEHPHAAPAEQIQVERETAIHRFHQRQTFQEKFSRYLNGIAHHGLKRGVERARAQVIQSVSVSLEDVQRQVHAIFFQIHRHILPEIGELQRGARSVRHPVALRVGIAT
jgi:hypothetical protein